MIAPLPARLLAMMPRPVLIFFADRMIRKLDVLDGDCDLEPDDPPEDEDEPDPAWTERLDQSDPSQHLAGLDAGQRWNLSLACEDRECV